MYYTLLEKKKKKLSFIFGVRAVQNLKNIFLLVFLHVGRHRLKKKKSDDFSFIFNHFIFCSALFVF